ncbi:MAG: RES domain-containing protein [Bacteroidales bacterium]|nr:RES domain-containing protein [Bacteroidales bacterium]
MNICANCFIDEELKRYIGVNSKDFGDCNFCGNTNEKVLPIVELSDIFHEFFSIFENSLTGKSLWELLAIDWDLINPEIIDQQRLINALLETTQSNHLISADGVQYIEEVRNYVSKWESLKKEIKEERRFLINTEDLEWDKVFNDATSNITEKKFYRGRIQEKGSVFTEVDLFCPPKEKATAGRSNPHGIPYLYLCQSFKTTFYETRAVYLDVIFVATFKAKSGISIKLVDFTSKESIMDWDGRIKFLAKKNLFFKAVSKDLSKPLRRFDSEIEYIPTQFICEYIKHFTEADGIVFESSVHKGGVNYVIFDQNKMEIEEIRQYRIKEVALDSEEII